jgi:CheY-like chemotaxis protein
VKYEPVHSCPSPLMTLKQRRITNAMGDMHEHTRKMDYVLLVDNDPAVRRNVCEYFSDHNVPTSSVSDWNELKCSGGAPPSLIVMDQTGGGDGLDRLRSIRSKSDVPVIMTGRSSDEIDRVVGLELGADDYIVKPLALGNCSHVFVPYYAEGWRAPPEPQIRNEAAINSVAGGSSVVAEDL